MESGLTKKKSYIRKQNNMIVFEESILTVNILRNWDRDKIVRFAEHLLGELHGKDNS